MEATTVYWGYENQKHTFESGGLRQALDKKFADKANQMPVCGDEVLPKLLQELEKNSPAEPRQALTKSRPCLNQIHTERPPRLSSLVILELHC